MALIKTSDYDGLPLEPIRRWLKLKDLLDARLGRVGVDHDGYTEGDLEEYCTVLVNAAEVLELGQLSEFRVGSIRDDYPRIRSEIIALATRLSIKSATAYAENSVALARSSKHKIFSQIAILREAINSSDLSQAHKTKLNSKLDELHSLVNGSRTDFGQIMRIFAYVSMSIGGTTAFLADAPAAVATIAAIIGEAKEEEEAEQLAIEAETKPKLIEYRQGQTGSDNDIPF